MRIFISSPSDLAPERRIVLQVVSRLAAEFKHHFELTPVLWEHEPLLATEHFQEGLISPADCDFMVCMLWSRLGSALPADRFQRTDGSHGVTGTEWEFLMAVEAFRARGAPEILFYRKQTPVQVSLDDEAEVARAQGEKRRVEAFFQRHFHNQDAEQTFKSAYWPFNDIDALETLVYTHLSSLLRERVARPGSGAAAPVAERVRWHQGSPFRGLRSFDFEHAEIFFGRNRARNELLGQFQTQVARHTPFMAVLGTSGSGKSSLVKAGLLPVLTTAGVLPGVAECRWCVFKPSDATDGLLEALLRAIATCACLPELCPTAEALEGALARVRSAPHALEALVFSTLVGIKQQVGYRDNLSIKLVIVIDQLEELFSAPNFTDTQRADFVSLLASLVHSQHTWVIATMRSDFYAHCESTPELVSLMRASGQFHLTPASAEEIGQMIAMPARAAALTFERDADGIGLDEVLRAQAAGQPSILPLLSFTLEQLFEQRREGVLTYAAYHALGGIEGAITRQAERVFHELTAQAQDALPALLSALVSLRGGDTESVAARRCPWAFVVQTPARQRLTEAFVAARLLTVTGERATGAAVVAVAHEALLRGWQRASDSIAENLEYLRTRARLASTARFWDQEGRPEALLIPGGRLLEQAAALLDRQRAELSEVELAFIDASESALARRQQAEADAQQRLRRARRRTLFAVASVALILAAATLLVLQGREAQMALQAIAAEQADRNARSRIDSFTQLSLAQTAAGNPLNAIHLGLEAARQAPAGRSEGAASAQAALYAAVWAQPRRWSLDGAAVDSTDGSWLLVDGEPARLFDAASGRWRDLDLASRPGSAVAPGGSHAALRTADGHAVLLSLAGAAPARQDLAATPAPPGAAGGATFSPDGHSVAVWSSVGSIEVFDVATGSFRARLEPGARIEQAALSANGQRLAVLAQDLHILDILTGAQRRVPRRQIETSHGGSTRQSGSTDHIALGFVAGGLLIESAAGAVSLWSATDGTQRAQLAETTAGAIQISATHALVRPTAHSLQLWDLERAWPAATIVHERPIRHALLSASGDLMVTADAAGTVRSFDAAGRLLAIYRPRHDKLDGGPGAPLALHLTTAGDRAVVAWRERLEILVPREGRVLARHAYAGQLASALTQAGDWLLARESPERLLGIDLATGQVTLRLQPGYELQPVAVAPRGRRFATLAFDRLLESWSLADGSKHLSVVAGRTSSGVRYLAGGRHLIARDAERAVLWAADGSSRVRQIAAPTPVLASALDDATGLLVLAGRDWLRAERSDGTELGRRSLSAPPDRLALAPGAEHLALAYPDGSVEVLDLGTALGLGSVARHLQVDSPVVALDFSADGNRLLVATAGRELRVYAMPSYRLILKASHWQPVRSLAPGPAAGFYSTTDGAVVRWRGGARPALAGRVALPGPVDAVLAGSASLTALVRVRSMQTLVYDEATDEVRGRIGIARPEIATFAASPDGRRLVTATVAGVVRLWDLNETALPEPLTDLDAQMLALNQATPERVCAAERDRLLDRRAGCSLHRAPTRLLFSSDGTRLAVSRDGQGVLVFSVADGGRLLARSVQGRVVGFSLDGRALLLEGSGGALGTQAIADDAAQKSFTGRLPLRPYRSTVALRGGAERLIPFVDGWPREDLATVWREAHAVLDVEPTSGLALAAVNGGVRLIDVAEGTTLAQVAAVGDQVHASFSSGGRAAVVTDAGGVRILPIYATAIEQVANEILGGG